MRADGCGLPRAVAVTSRAWKKVKWHGHAWMSLGFDDLEAEGLVHATRVQSK